MAGGEPVSNSTYDNLILSRRSSLLAYWEMADAVGSLSAADTSGNGRSLTAFNGPTFGAGTGPILGDPDTPVGLDGVNDYLTAAGTPFNVETLSVEFWAKTSATSGTVIGKWGGNGTYPWMVGNAPGGQIFVQCSDGATTKLVMAATPTNDAAWHHIVCVREASDRLAVYVDGQLSGEAASLGLGPTGNADDLNVGVQSNHLAGWWSGSLAKVAIYNRALTDAEILQDYRTGVMTIQTVGAAAFRRKHRVVRPSHLSHI